ncbi:hypothetical protein FXF62_08705 [Streptococcus cristatus]|uniref:Uncharacterized protein n=1 Tax=Streptococcus cristatus TaxID=45634 RepID=A0A5B0DAI8_STRCR|nr:hypothetical protein FXF62_08705 [Streptococcus cristatus]
MAAKTKAAIVYKPMFLLQIYLIIEFKIPYYSIINSRNSQINFLKKKTVFCLLLVKKALNQRI